MLGALTREELEGCGRLERRHLLQRRAGTPVLLLRLVDLVFAVDDGDAEAQTLSVRSRLVETAGVLRHDDRVLVVIDLDGNSELWRKVTTLTFSLMYVNRNGLARRLSTGTPKKPCTSLRYKSMVMNRDAPALQIISATSLPAMLPRRHILHCLLYGM